MKVYIFVTLDGDSDVVVGAFDSKRKAKDKLIEWVIDRYSTYNRTDTLEYQDFIKAIIETMKTDNEYLYGETLCKIFTKKVE